jgi:hypothetical protein
MADIVKSLERTGQLGYLARRFRGPFESNSGDTHQQELRKTAETCFRGTEQFLTGMTNCRRPAPTDVLAGTDDCRSLPAFAPAALIFCVRYVFSVSICFHTEYLLLTQNQEKTKILYFHFMPLVTGYFCIHET